METASPTIIQCGLQVRARLSPPAGLLVHTHTQALTSSCRRPHARGSTSATGARLSVTFAAMPPTAVRDCTRHDACGRTILGDAAKAREEARQRTDREVRIALTEVVQRAVEALGRQVSGSLLMARSPSHIHRQNHKKRIRGAPLLRPIRMVNQ